MHGHGRALEMKHEIGLEHESMKACREITGQDTSQQNLEEEQEASDQGCKDIQLVRTAFRNLQK